ncbi:excalibur calcium-binding domain-containing protein [Rhodobacter sp. NTK016B]|uniref:excalibur calcium-binding domain-containing protein n=1 Tax=Rhodobacter sp. NTK016B TaxID=2759676 RepID=UPI001A8CBA82|nr:excalibur calcium-binding domain-containing protein [Rhodobacter sp. NTK016B]MBN8294069.1 excalibur calcium-binding domain-containing protein [Rhodobacter sp. NTK016B]
MKSGAGAATALALVLASGPARAQECDPNYAQVCVPVASDVDCAGGSGDGPAYVEGPVQVIGDDIYHLDRDGDGIACEPPDDD